MSESVERKLVNLTPLRQEAIEKRTGWRSIRAPADHGVPRLPPTSTRTPLEILLSPQCRSVNDQGVNPLRAPGILSPWLRHLRLSCFGCSLPLRLVLQAVQSQFEAVFDPQLLEPPG